MKSLNNKDPLANGVINFDITESMKKAGISEFILKGTEFILTFSDGGKRWCSYSKKKDSLEVIANKIRKKLKKELETGFQDATFQDIENQLIERQDEIFNDCSSNEYQEDLEFSKFLDRVATLRNEYEASGVTFEQWQNYVKEKYENLRDITLKNFPDAWPLLQFCLAVKSILNIDGCTLPFMGVILAIPSSMKTLVIQLFRKYPHSLYSDNFTPNSFESHNAALSEEQLRKVDLLPKLTDKLFLTPELAPIFTTNEDELRKSLGIITRILDGHGLETDSGAQGHRRYGNTFFVWIGAAVEIPYRVWLLLGTLGHKVYMFRPIIREKSIQELQKIAKENDFQNKFEETELALLEYLIEFDAAPANGNVTADRNGITKVAWNENKGDDQDDAIICIVQVANLLKRLRGTVFVSVSKGRTRRYDSRRSTEIKDDNSDKNVSREKENQDSNFLNIDESDYDTDYPIVEDPSRAVVLLRNLALGNAISQGRDYINLDDLPLVINVALSTTTRARSELIRLLLEHDGELTTSAIVRESKISPPFAKKTMRELAALGIVDITAVDGYKNSELKITLTNEYSWFKGEQFKELLNRHQIVLNDSDNGPTSVESTDNSDNNQRQLNELADKNNENVAGSRQSAPNSCDNEVIASRVETNTESHTKIFEVDNNDHYKNSDQNHFNNGDNFDKNNIQQSCECKSEITLSNNHCDNQFESEENNTPLWKPESFQHVTLSRAQTQSKTIEQGEGNQDSKQRDVILDKMLEEIRNANGSTVSIATVLESVHRRYEFARTYLGNKLTQRENRKVRQLYLDVIHTNDIEVVKYKPQLLVRWNSSEEHTNKAGVA